MLVQFLETERRKKDIDLIEPSHPLLPVALHCLKNRDTERPSADELCGRLASLKREPRYTYSVEQTRGHIQRLQEGLGRERATLERERAELERERVQLERERVEHQRAKLMKKKISFKDNCEKKKISFKGFSKYGASNESVF